MNSNVKTIKDHLRENKEVHVSFMKLDGSLRKMICTMHPDIVPQNSVANPNPKKKIPDDIIIAWDIENNGFRSFHFDQLIDYVVYEGDN